MEFTTERIGTALMIRLQPARRPGRTGEIFAVFQELIDRQNCGPVLVDLSAMETLSQEAVSALEKAHASASQIGIPFALAGPKPSVLRLLFAAGLTSRMAIYPAISDESTLAALYPAAFDHQNQPPPDPPSARPLI